MIGAGTTSHLLFVYVIPSSTFTSTDVSAFFLNCLSYISWAFASNCDTVGSDIPSAFNSSIITSFIGLIESINVQIHLVAHFFINHHNSNHATISGFSVTKSATLFTRCCILYGIDSHSVSARACLIDKSNDFGSSHTRLPVDSGLIIKFVPNIAAFNIVDGIFPTNLATSWNHHKNHVLPKSLAFHWNVGSTNGIISLGVLFDISCLILSKFIWFTYGISCTLLKKKDLPSSGYSFLHSSNGIQFNISAANHLAAFLTSGVKSEYTASTWSSGIGSLGFNKSPTNHTNDIAESLFDFCSLANHMSLTCSSIEYGQLFIFLIDSQNIGSFIHSIVSDSFSLNSLVWNIGFCAIVLSLTHGIFPIFAQKLNWLVFIAFDASGIACTVLVGTVVVLVGIGTIGCVVPWEESAIIGILYYE